jgi:hypothetical protein
MARSKSRAGTRAPHDGLHGPVRWWPGCAGWLVASPAEGRMAAFQRPAIQRFGCRLGPLSRWLSRLIIREERGWSAAGVGTDPELLGAMDGLAPR